MNYLRPAIIALAALAVVVLAGSAVAGPPGSSTMADVWVINRDGRAPDDILKLDGKGRQLLSIALGTTTSVSVDVRDESVWVPVWTSLVKLSPDGSELLRVDGLAVDAVDVSPVDGSVWVGVPGEDQVVKLDAGGNELLRVDGFGAPASIDVDPNDGSVWVADGGGAGGRKVVKLDSGGTVLFARSVTPSYFFSNAPEQIAVDPNDGSVWFINPSTASSVTNGTLTHLTSTGSEILRISGFDRPTSVAVDPSDGSVWVTDNNHDVPESGFVAKLDQDGNEFVRVTDVDVPVVLGVDSADGAVWVGGHETLLKLGPDGKELAAIGGFGDILDIAVSPPVPVECTDLNDDGKVSGRDVEIVARAMPSGPGSKRWNPEADLDDDQDVDLDDFRIVIRALVEPDCR